MKNKSQLTKIGKLVNKKIKIKFRDQLLLEYSHERIFSIFRLKNSLWFI